MRDKLLDIAGRAKAPNSLRSAFLTPFALEPKMPPTRAAFLVSPSDAGPLSGNLLRRNRVRAVRLVVLDGFGRRLQPSLEHAIDLVEIEIDHRGDVKRQQLRHQQAADDRDAQRLPQFGAGAGCQARSVVRRKLPPDVVIMIGRKRSRQASRIASSADRPTRAALRARSRSS